MRDELDYSSIFFRPVTPGRSNITPAFVTAAGLFAGLTAALILASRLQRRIQRTMQGLGLLALNRAHSLEKQRNDHLSSRGPDKRKQQQQNGRAGAASDGDDDEGGLNLEGSDYIYPGLLNTSTTCYLNSALQSLASCPSFMSYLEALVASTAAPALDDSHDTDSDDVLNVTRALSKFLEALNTPTRNSQILRTGTIVSSLLDSTSNSPASRNRKRIMRGSGQQDAQEFFLILTEAVEEEKKELLQSVEKKAKEKEGFPELLLPKELLQAMTTWSTDKALKSPFQAMMAARTACMTCGYMEAIRHTHTEHLTLNVPAVRSCRLESLLAEHTKLECIEEYTCRRCSIMTTLARLRAQVDHAKTENTSSAEPMSTSKRKRLRDLQRSVQRLQEIVDNEDFEFDSNDKQIKIDRVAGPATKQVMYSTPPKLLVLHLSRSSYLDSGYGYSSKNNCQVQFPELLVLDPYTTTDRLSSNPSQPISSHSQAPENKREDGKMLPKHIYRICSLVVHFGNHHNGHYVSFRRRPTTASQRPSNDWFRISDEDVEGSSREELLGANPYLLFYERVEGLQSQPAVKPLATTE